VIMLMRRRVRTAPGMTWAIGQSLPLGYAAISVAAPRRRRMTAWLWALGVVPASAARVAAWVKR
jgi:hypothetical protein